MTNNIIESFETSKTGVFGDILSQKKEKRRIKVGLLACGYFEYWRMYPESLEKNVTNDLNIIVNRLKAEFDVVFPNIIDTLDSADKAGKKFKEEKVDVLIVVEGTYLPDFISLHAINMVKEVPVLFFSVQLEEDVDKKGDYEHSLRNSGIIGLAQLTGTYKKTKRPYKVVVGSVNDDRAYNRIRAFIKSVQAIDDVREANIGVIGHVFRGMYDLELSKTFLKGAFDVNVIYIQGSHIMELWNEAKEDEINEIVEGLIGRFKMRDVTRDDVYRACRLAVAMRKVAEKFNLNAMCFLDQHYVQKQTKTTARIGASLLLEKYKFPITCEGDLGGLVMMMLMQSISGISPLMGEWGEYDVSNNGVLIMGHGIGDPSLAISDENVTLTRTPEEWGFSGSGLNYEYIVKPGMVTLGHILEIPDGYKMLISKGESIKYPTLHYDELHAMVKVDTPIKEYLEKLLASGVAHHCMLGMTDMTQALQDVADLLGLEKYIL